MKTKQLLYAMLALFFMASCASSRNITYFQDLDTSIPQANAVKYETKIKCDDELSILVSCSNMSLAQPYNINVATPDYSSIPSLGEAPEAGAKPADITYRVDSNGDINFPVFGKIHVEGMTREQLVEYLTNEIKKDIKDPVVTITVTNFNITIIGDISSPGNYTFNSEKVNIIQALAEAGDLSETAKIDDIILIRKVNGKQTYDRIDMKSKHILESEQFYLQQNDILYVLPDKTKMTQKNEPLKIWAIITSTITSTLAIASFFL